MLRKKVIVLSSTAPFLRPQMFAAAHHTKSFWMTVSSQHTAWVVPVGLVTASALIVHHAPIPWPSPVVRKVWRRLRFGVDDRGYDALRSRFDALFYETTPWRYLSCDLLTAFTAQPATQWHDAAHTALARLVWRPLMVRTGNSSHPSGWQHPRLPALVFADFPVLTPVFERLDWTQPLGPALQRALTAWFSEAPNAWFDAVLATHLPIERLIGTQFALWHTLGLGFFDATSPLADWVASSPSDEAWHDLVTSWVHV